MHEVQRFCERVGIRYPIVQAGMGNVAGHELAAAVSEAGGLGVIGGAELEPEDLRNEIRRLKALTSKPFGVDLLFASVNMPEPEQTAPEQGEQLPPFAFGSKVQEQMAVVLSENVPVLVSGLAAPGAFVGQAHRRGMTVMSLVGSVSAARKVEQDGVDYVIAQGHEAGGHTGRSTTFTLVPEVASAVHVPVLAAGGVADARGLLAAFALGAVGVWVGTRFVASVEAAAHPRFKQKIVESAAADTVVTRAFTGKTARAFVNEFTQEWAADESKIGSFPDQYRRAGDHFAGMRDGDVDRGFMPAGQACSLIDDVPSAGQIVSGFVEGYNRLFEQMPDLRWQPTAVEGAQDR